MGVTLAELRLLGKTLDTPKWDILATDVAVYFDSKLGNLKLQTYQSISPAKVREKPPENAKKKRQKLQSRERFDLSTPGLQHQCSNH